MTPARDSIILVIVNLDPLYTQSGWVEVPIEDFGEIDTDSYEVDDLLTDTRYIWHGKRNYVALHPGLPTRAHPARAAIVAGWVGDPSGFDCKARRESARGQQVARYCDKQ